MADAAKREVTPRTMLQDDGGPRTPAGRAALARVLARRRAAEEARLAVLREGLAQVDRGPNTSAEIPTVGATYAHVRGGRHLRYVTVLAAEPNRVRVRAIRGSMAGMVYDLPTDEYTDLVRVADA